MAYTSCVVACVLLILSEGAVGVPAPATSTSQSQGQSQGQVQAQVQGRSSPNFSTNMGIAYNNMWGGIDKLTGPIVHMGYNMFPGLVSKGMTTAKQALNKIVGAKKEAIGKVAGGLTDVVGSGAVLGSSLAGGAMQVAGSGISLANSGIKAGGEAGLSIAEKLGEKVAQVNEHGGKVASGALHGVAGAIQKSADGANAVTGSMSHLVDSVANYLAKSIHDSGNRAIQSMNRVSESAAAGSNASYESMKAMFDNILRFMQQMNQGLVTMMDNVSNRIVEASATDDLVEHALSESETSATGNTAADARTTLESDAEIAAPSAEVTAGLTL